jgi:hypothetical protein
MIGRPCDVFPTPDITRSPSVFKLRNILDHTHCAFGSYSGRMFLVSTLAYTGLSPRLTRAVTPLSLKDMNTGSIYGLPSEFGHLTDSYALFAYAIAICTLASLEAI